MHPAPRAEETESEANTAHSLIPFKLSSATQRQTSPCACPCACSCSMRAYACRASKREREREREREKAQALASSPDYTIRQPSKAQQWRKCSGKPPELRLHTAVGCAVPQTVPTGPSREWTVRGKLSTWRTTPRSTQHALTRFTPGAWALLAC